MWLQRAFAAKLPARGLWAPLFGARVIFRVSHCLSPLGHSWPKGKLGTITLDARDGPKPEMKAGASKIAPDVKPCLTPPRAPGLRNRPAPPGRALPFPAASKRGPFCMQIWGTDCLPIDNRERKRAFAEFRSMSWFRPRRKLILAELKLAIRWEPRFIPRS